MFFNSLIMPLLTVTQLEKEILYCENRAQALAEIAAGLKGGALEITVSLDCGGHRVLDFGLSEVIDPPLSFDLLTKLEYCFRQRVYQYETQLKDLRQLKTDGTKNRLTA